MELSKKTTILFSPQLHARLSGLARAQKTSLGELVRRAVVAQYGLVDAAGRVRAAQKLAALDLPVAEVAQMKSESVPPPKDVAG